MHTVVVPQSQLVNEGGFMKEQTGLLWVGDLEFKERDRIYSLDEINEIITQAAFEHIPRTSVKTPKKVVPWWCPEVESAIRACRKALRSLRSMQTNHLEYNTKLEASRRLKNASRKCEENEMGELSRLYIGRFIYH